MNILPGDHVTNFTFAWFVAGYFDLVKELARSLAWPLVVLIVTMRYRDEIRELVPRVRRAGPTGVEFEPANQQDTVKSDVVSESSKLQQKTYIPNSSPVVAEMEKRFKDDLSSFQDVSHVDVLVRELATARLAASFEFILSIIFGSQIEGLRLLDQMSTVTIDEARGFFETYRKANPDFYTNGFEGWLHFLKLQELVKEEDGKLKITDLGKEFLIFLTRRNVPYSKPF
jgi:hypothetical protein